MNTLAERVKFARERAGLTQQEVADLAGMKQPSYFKIETGKTKRTGFINKLANVLKVDSNWLETGNGEMTTKPAIRMAIDDPSSLPEALRDHLTADHGDDELDTDNFEAMLERYVPVISWVQAGDMTPVLSTCLTDVIEWIPRPSHLSKMAFGLVIRGRSMMPEFKPDEIIYVEPEFNPYCLRDGDLVVVSCDNDSEATFKQLVMGETSEDMYLKPLNPEWHNQEIRPMGECRLVGVVDGKYVRYRKHRQWH